MADDEAGAGATARSRVGDDALTDALLVFDDPRRSLAAVAAAIDQRHVPLRTVVVATKPGRSGRRRRTAVWFGTGV